MADVVQKGKTQIKPKKSSSEILDEIFKQLEEVNAKKGPVFSGSNDLTSVLASAAAAAHHDQKPLIADLTLKKEIAETPATTTSSSNNKRSSSGSRSRHKHKHKHKHKKSKKHKSRSRSHRSSSRSSDDKLSSRSRVDSSAKDERVSPSTSSAVQNTKQVDVVSSVKRDNVSVLDLIPRSVRSTNNSSSSVCEKVADSQLKAADAKVKAVVATDIETKLIELQKAKALIESAVDEETRTASAKELLTNSLNSIVVCEDINAIGVDGDGGEINCNDSNKNVGETADSEEEVVGCAGSESEIQQTETEVQEDDREDSVNGDEIIDYDKEVLDYEAGTNAETVQNDAEADDNDMEMADNDVEHADDAEEAENDAEVAENEEEVAENEAEVTENEAEVTENEAEVAENEAEVAENEAEVAENEAEVAENEAEIGESDAEVAENDAEIGESDAEVAENEAEVAENEAEMGESDAEVADNGSEIADNESGEQESGGEEDVEMGSHESDQEAEEDVECDELSRGSIGEQSNPSVEQQSAEASENESGEVECDEMSRSSMGEQSVEQQSVENDDCEQSGDIAEEGEEEDENGEILDGESAIGGEEDGADDNKIDIKIEDAINTNDSGHVLALADDVVIKKEQEELTEGPKVAATVKTEPTREGRHRSSRSSIKKEPSDRPDKSSSKSKTRRRSRHSSKRKSVRSKVTVINNAGKPPTQSRKRKSSSSATGKAGTVSESSSKRRKSSRDKKPRSSAKSSKPSSSSSTKLKSRSRSPRKESSSTRRHSKSPARTRRPHSPISRPRSPITRGRSPVSTLRSRPRRRSPSRDNFRRNRRSRSKGRSRSRSPRMEKIDKVKLLEIARKNALAMMAAGQLPKSLAVSVQKLKEEVVVPIKAGGKSVAELTDFCKVLSKKEMEEGECSDYDSNGTIHSPREDDDDDENNDDEPKKAKKEKEPFLHHPFKLREQPASIIVNIRNAVQIPTRTPAEKVAEGAKLRIQFPVSSGTQHRQKESEWVPVSPKKEGAEVVAKISDGAKLSDVAKLPATTTMTNTCTTVATMNEKVFAEIPEPPMPVLDIGAIVSERLKAVRQLMDNPENTTAMNQMHRSQEQMQYWAKSKQLPGQFTGSTDAQMLTPQQLAGPSCQAWVRKDQFANAAPVQSGFGLHILQKMGWKPGEGLGKNGDGTALPLLLDIKLDKKGLVTAGEIPRGCRRPPIRQQQQQQQQQMVQSIQSQPVRDLSGKHPVSALVELCNKRRWLPPEFLLVSDFGPDHQKNFLFKVRVHNVDYQPSTASPNKKHAKAQSATVALEALGLLARNQNNPS